VTVPLVEKFSDADSAALTLPDALTLDCTVPSATVDVRCAALLAVEVLKNP
jgi:hypothetical protein